MRLVDRCDGVGAIGRRYGIELPHVVDATMMHRRIEQRHDADDAHPGHQPRFVAVGGRNHDGVVAGPHGGEHRGEDAIDRPEPAVESEFAEVHDALDRLRGDLTGRGEAGDRDREVEPRPVLRQGCR